MRNCPCDTSSTLGVQCSSHRTASSGSSFAACVGRRGLSGNSCGDVDFGLWKFLHPVVGQFGGWLLLLKCLGALASCWRPLGGSVDVWSLCILNPNPQRTFLTIIPSPVSPHHPPLILLTPCSVPDVSHPPTACAKSVLQPPNQFGG